MKGRAVLCLIGASLLSSSNANAKHREQLSPITVAREDSPAIVQITYWGAKIDSGQRRVDFNVDGTGFLVGREGYFVTAAHVLQRYQSSSGHLTATIHERNSGGSGIWFDVIETDQEHDLALCKLKVFKPMKEPRNATRPKDTYFPIASLKVSEEPPLSGEPIALLGFPLGSFISPIIQVGNIGATDAMLDAVPNFPAGRRDLLIVSVSGNHGNSGSPVVSLLTGNVVGMVIQYVPAPLMSIQEGQARQNLPQQSGLMVAIPAKWIIQILARHGVANAAIELGENFVI